MTTPDILATIGYVVSLAGLASQSYKIARTHKAGDLSKIEVVCRCLVALIFLPEYIDVGNTVLLVGHIWFMAATAIQLMYAIKYRNH